MKSSWDQWEGITVGGKFPLQKYVGQSNHGVVYLTQGPGAPSQQAAIKLIRSGGNLGDRKAAEWSLASSLRHPHVLEVFEWGSCRIADTEFLYVVMEYADENLQEIVSDRKLSIAEAEEMLPPVLDALAFLHGQHLVHGRLKPSNILAVGDHIKISPDSIHSASGAGRAPATRTSDYDPPEIIGGAGAAGDIWSLGMTLMKASGVQLPAAGDGSAVSGGRFVELLDHCLDPDPEKRWTVEQIRSWLKGVTLSAPTARPRDESAAASRPRGGSRAKLLTIAAVVGAILIAGIVALLWNHSSTPAQSPAASATLNPAAPAVTQEAKPAASADRTPPVQSLGSDSAGAVAQQVVPNVSPSARRTSQGHIRVKVRVKVDASGSVTRASLASSGPSRYFAGLARSAAQDWKFSAPQRNGLPVASTWILNFAFGRSSTQVDPVQVSP
jgi:TonB family protein